MASPSRQGHVSPASSPRLPSPPPFPEVQIGPRSPSPHSSRDPLEPNSDRHSPDQSASRRIRPGTKAADMASGPPLIPLSELDSPFQLQEHLKALYLDATRSEQNTNTTVPITRETATILATPPENVDRSLWLYELCRFLVQKANSLIVGFFSDNPPCSAKDCPEMRASEWQYLCAVHDPPKSCCAIDYCCHTLDWAANILTSQKHFPSRLTLGGPDAPPGGTQASVRQLTNIFRRVYRMFAHAWFQHKEVFWSLENQEGIYIFYKTVCDVYSLIPEENYTIPPEAEGLEADDQAEHRDYGMSGRRDGDFMMPPEYGATQQRRTTTTTATMSEKPPISNQPSDDSASAQTTMSTGATTRRHKHTPSTGSFVTTIAEGDEEEGGGGSEALREPDPPRDRTSIQLDQPPLLGKTADLPLRMSEPSSPAKTAGQSESQLAEAREEEEEEGTGKGGNNEEQEQQPGKEETPGAEPLVIPKPGDDAEPSAEGSSQGITQSG